MTFFQRRQGLLPYLLLAPGLLFLVFFFAVPLYYMARTSLETGTIFTGYQFNWHFETYTDAISNYDQQLIRSFVYAGASTAFALAIGYPLAYAIAFRGGKWKTALLLLVILPFFVTYLIRTLSWRRSSPTTARWSTLSRRSGSWERTVASLPRALPSSRASPTTSCRS